MEETFDTDDLYEQDELEEQEDERCTYEQYPLDLSFYEDARFM